MKGFTLVELLVAIAITAILVGVSLNVYVVIHHGFAESTIRYGRFVGENVHELRCRTRFVRVDQLLAALFGQRRDVDADDLAVVDGGQPEIRLEDGLFDSLEAVLVPGLDGDAAAVGNGD